LENENKFKKCKKENEKKISTKFVINKIYIFKDMEEN